MPTRIQSLRRAAIFASIAIAAALAPPRPILAVPQPVAPAPATLPDTPAGKVAAAFLAMLADGSEQAVASFESTHGSSKRRAGAGIAERVPRVQEMRAEWKTFTPRAVTAATDTGLTLRVAVAGGETIEMEFQLSPTEPGKLDAVLISSSGDKPAPITSEERAKVVNGAAKALADNYVYADAGRRMGESVRKKLAAGEYDSITDDVSLARRLTEDFRAISSDKHLRVRVAPPPSPQSEADPHRRDLDEARARNYGFKKVEILPGNIGYIRFDNFLPDDDAKKVAGAALAFVAGCDALIFDMRSNGGGDPEMVRFITGYLFDKPTHLNSMYDRTEQEISQSWSQKDVPGRRFAPGLPVYILTSSRTFSCAEEFSYDLQCLERATIVGETTGGGAHPIRPVRLGDRFAITIPYMRAHNPITMTNWEGSGVQPDVPCAAAEALDKAAELARKAIEKKK